MIAIIFGSLLYLIFGVLSIGMLNEYSPTRERWTDWFIMLLWPGFIVVGLVYCLSTAILGLAYGLSFTAAGFKILYRHLTKGDE